MVHRKPFEHEPVSHAVAHYLVSICELLEEYGYARVSDVARRVGNTRGSASITLKGLREKGLVTQDDRRFLGLSDAGRRIAESLRAKRAIFRDLLVRMLGVDEEQAAKDTCRMEHLVSGETAQQAARLLEYLDSGSKTASAFLAEFEEFDPRSGEGDEETAGKKTGVQS